MIMIYGTFWSCSWFKTAKNDREWQKFVCHVSYLRNHASYDCHLCYICVKLWYLQVCVFFFSFLKKLWFSGFLGGGGKRAKKLVLNDKKFCLSHSRSKEPYIIWFSFIVHMCKMVISLGFFSFFHNFDFLDC